MWYKSFSMTELVPLPHFKSSFHSMLLCVPGLGTLSHLQASLWPPFPYLDWEMEYFLFFQLCSIWSSQMRYLEEYSDVMSRGESFTSWFFPGVFWGKAFRTTMLGLFSTRQGSVWKQASLHMFLQQLQPDFPGCWLSSLNCELSLGGLHSFALPHPLLQAAAARACCCSPLLCSKCYCSHLSAHQTSW